MRIYSTREKGASAEVLAANYLRDKGYIIRQTNFYCRYGELDIIAEHNRQIIFVEVKSVIQQLELSPYELLSAIKLTRLQRTIDYWLTKYTDLTREWRFEYIAIVLDADRKLKQVIHIPDPEL